MTIDFNFEKNLPYSLIAGLDEVGRGPLAGPVAAGAFVFLNGIPKKELKLLRDSKLLSVLQRERLFEYFLKLKEAGDVDFSWAFCQPKIIDKRHIQNAVALAMQRAVDKLSCAPNHAIIDKFSYRKKILQNVEYTLIRKADNLVPSCAAASIVAKVKRDAIMRRYHKKFPEYHFDLHKGYGTELHYKMLKKYGPSPIHRQSFRLT